MSQNAQLGKIATQTAFKARSRFNLDHDYNTTLTFGETQPSFIREMIPGSKLEIKTNSLVRLAPMPAPTFGRMKIENRSHFIPLSSLVKHFQDSFLTQTIVSEGDKTFQVETLPHIQLARLCWYILTGAKCTIYKTAALDESYRTQTVKGFNVSDSTSMAALETLLASLQTSHYLTANQAATPPIGEYGGNFLQIVPERLFNLDDDITPLDLTKCTTIPLANKNTSPGNFGLNRVGTLDTTGEGDFAHGAVHLNSADYVHTITRTNGDVIHFAFRLSNFGKRLRKILIGLGYQIDFRAKNEVSILPLFAYYKAYFDSFGLTLYQNYLQTNACKCLTHFDYFNFPSFNDYDGTLPRQTFRNFIYDLGNCFATAPQDYVSSHMTQTAVSPSAQNALTFIDTDPDNIPIVHGDSSDGILAQSGIINGHAYISDVIHSHLDSEYLKKLYKWTNRNTIAGKRIREILISQGFGDWVDKQKTYFIGQDEQRIEIMEISATADTTAVGGSSLGEWAGKGRSEKTSKVHSYETDEHGYFITISTLVPEGGYTQALSDHVNEISKFDFYNPEFDSMGYDASRFSETVCGTQNWSQHGGSQDDAKASLAETFGFKPRYLEKKVQFNKMNGDFSLRSTRNSYLPYTLDKLIDVGEREVTETQRVANEPLYFVKKLFPLTDIPSAGDVWRYYYRYAWLSNFNRIFVNGGNIQYSPQGDEIDFISQEMEATQADNFLMHQYNEVTYFAPMLSISHSYETTDDYGGSSHDMGKA